MFERLRDLVLRLLRVPPEPAPPLGDPSSLRVFRASRKLYWLRLIGWAGAQTAALLGILFWLGVLLTAEHQATTAETAPASTKRTTRALKRQHRPAAAALKDMVSKVPHSVFRWLWIAKGLGIGLYLGQLAISYAVVRLDYEMRWYLVTDRSLRIRSGLWRVQELTMSFANLQQVVVSQGPLQRLLGIADVRVQSAGGGGGSSDSHRGQRDSTHTGVFHGVEHALEVRDLILNRLRLFRETGLGDPDEPCQVASRSVSPRSSTTGLPLSASEPEVLTAARELLSAASQLRRSLESPSAHSAQLSSNQPDPGGEQSDPTVSQG